MSSRGADRGAMEREALLKALLNDDASKNAVGPHMQVSKFE